MEELTKLAEVFTSKIGNYTVKTPERKAIAREALTNPSERSAIILIMALRNLYGVDFLSWEPETLWLTLEKDGIILNEITRDKVQAAITLFVNPAFFWDNLVFQRTVQALNEVPYDPSSLQECEVAHMCWAIYEATLLRTLDPEDKAIPEFDDDVQQYVAVCLQRAGFVYAPTQLKFAHDNLLNMLPSKAREISTNVKNSWEHIPKDNLRDRIFSEDALGIQLFKLTTCYLYVEDHTESMATDVLDLENATTV